MKESILQPDEVCLEYNEECWLDQINKLRSIGVFCFIRVRLAGRNIRGNGPRNVLIVTIICWLVLFATFLSFGLHYASTSAANNMYKEYDIGASIGPTRNDLLTPENTTTWLHGANFDRNEWFMRLDDQSLIPMHLVDEQELRYDQFLRTRYPEMAEVADTLAWTSPEFLRDPNALMMPVDNLFHMGHCVRTFRRYWQAKETGRHVCPVDIDYRHIWHCFEALEDHFYPLAPRALDESSMSWRTKVCSYE